MSKYHKNIYFPLKHHKRLKVFNNRLNTIKYFNYSNHAKNQIFNRVHDLKYFYDFMKYLILEYDNIFEYTMDNDIIYKIAYRIKYDNEKDIILSINQDKKIITIYFNNSSDKHKTLNTREYITQ